MFHVCHVMCQEIVACFSFLLNSFLSLCSCVSLVGENGSELHHCEFTYAGSVLGSELHHCEFTVCSSVLGKELKELLIDSNFQ